MRCRRCRRCFRVREKYIHTLPLCPVLRRSTQLEGELHEHVVCKHRTARAACDELGVPDEAGIVAAHNGAKAVHAQQRMLPAQQAYSAVACTSARATWTHSMAPGFCAVQLCSGRRCARCAGSDGTPPTGAGSLRPNNSTRYRRCATSGQATSCCTSASTAAASSLQALGSQGALPGGCTCATTTSAASSRGEETSNPSRPTSCAASGALSCSGESSSTASTLPSLAASSTGPTPEATTTLRCSAQVRRVNLRLVTAKHAPQAFCAVLERGSAVVLAQQLRNAVRRSAAGVWKRMRPERHKAAAAAACRLVQRCEFFLQGIVKQLLRSGWRSSERTLPRSTAVATPSTYSTRHFGGGSWRAEASAGEQPCSVRACTCATFASQRRAPAAAVCRLAPCRTSTTSP